MLTTGAWGCLLPLAQGGFPQGSRGYYGDGHMFAAPWGWFWILVFIVFVVVLASWIFGRTGANRAGESALDILKKRYAKGEITREEFNRMKNDIEQETGT